MFKSQHRHEQKKPYFYSRPIEVRVYVYDTDFKYQFAGVVLGTYRGSSITWYTLIRGSIVFKISA